jgi:hypothetical protein
MPRPCSICTHPEVQAMDQALQAGERFAGVARRFAVSEDALGRHARHTPARLLAPAVQDPLALSAEAWRLHAAALQLTYHPVGVLELLQGITRLLVELTAGAAPPPP